MPITLKIYIHADLAQMNFSLVITFTRQEKNQQERKKTIYQFRCSNPPSPKELTKNYE